MRIERALSAHGLVRRDEERVAQLMGDDDRADVLEVAQLDHLFVDRRRRDRVEPGRRLVVEQDARLGRHRARDRHAPALSARQLRRHPVDELLEADEPEHLLARAAAPRRAACRSLRTACSRRSPRPSANRRARLPGTPCRGRTAPSSAPARSSLSTRLPLTKIVPPSGFSKPRISFRIVDFPEPLPPRMILVWPGSSAKLTSFRTTLSSKASETLSSTMRCVDIGGGLMPNTTA